MVFYYTLYQAAVNKFKVIKNLSYFTFNNISSYIILVYSIKNLLGANTSKYFNLFLKYIIFKLS
jgi:hypothetical protein